MYGHTPPAVIAIDPEWLTDCGAFQRIAAALQSQLRRRPVWAVVAAPERLVEADGHTRQLLLEGWCRTPRDAPGDVADPHVAVATVLAQHLADLGAPIAVRSDIPERPPVTSAVMPGTWRDAATAARRLGAGFVIAWAVDPEWMPARQGTVPFRYERPGQSGIWDSPALA